MGKKEHTWLERPLEIIHGGRRFVPVAKNGYFVASFVYKIMKEGGIEIGGQKYKVASTHIQHGARGKPFRYVCAADLKRISDAYASQSDKLARRAEIMKHIQDHAETYAAHHYTYHAFTRMMSAKLGYKISRFIVRDAVLRVRRRDPRILIGLRQTPLLARMLEEQPELRVARPLYETIRHHAEKRFGCRFTHPTIKRAIEIFDSKRGHPTEQIDREQWATLDEAKAYLGVSGHTILGAKNKGRLVVKSLMHYRTYVSWASLRAYKERRDAFFAKYPNCDRSVRRTTAAMAGEPGSQTGD